MTRYTYLGDRMTDPALKGATCTALRRADGKCIRGRNGNMLVLFGSGRTATVIGRLLRKIKADTDEPTGHLLTTPAGNTAHVLGSVNMKPETIAMLQQVINVAMKTPVVEIKRLSPEMEKPAQK